MWIYIFGRSGNLLQEVDDDCVHLKQVCLALLSEEVIDIPLRGDLLHEGVDVDRLESVVWMGKWDPLTFFDHGVLLFLLYWWTLASLLYVHRGTSDYCSAKYILSNSCVYK